MGGREDGREDGREGGWEEGREGEGGKREGKGEREEEGKERGREMRQTYDKEKHFSCACYYTIAIRKSSRDETVLRYFGFVCDSRLMYNKPSISEQGEIPPSLECQHHQ